MEMQGIWLIDVDCKHARITIAHFLLVVKVLNGKQASLKGSGTLSLERVRLGS